MAARILPHAEASRIRKLPRATRDPQLLRALLAGEVIHYEDTRSHFNGTLLRQRHGVQLRTRLDGAGGCYWWVEPLS